MSTSTYTYIIDNLLHQANLHNEKILHTGKSQVYYKVTSERLCALIQEFARLQRLNSVIIKAVYVLSLINPLDLG